MRKFLFLILAAVSLSFAAYDLFPVPQNKGANFRLNTNLNFGSVDYSSETQYFTRLILDMRFYYKRIEVSMMGLGVENDAVNGNGITFANNMFFGAKYQLFSTFAFIFDLNYKEVYFYESDAEPGRSFDWKLGAQFSKKINQLLVFGSEIGFGYPSEFELEGKDEKIIITPGKFLYLKGEVDYSLTRKIILFAAVDFDIKMTDSEYSFNPYGGRGNYDAYDKYGAGAVLFQLNVGISYKFSKQFSIEEDNFIRFGALRSSSFGIAVILKYNL